jgi:hypothetical protein
MNLVKTGCTVKCVFFLQIPAALVYGENDARMRDSVEKIMSTIPNSQLFMLKGAGKTKDYKIGICCFFANTLHKVKEKEQRLVGLESE